MSNLDDKIAARSGRLQLIVAAMIDIARVAEDPNCDEEMLNHAAEQIVAQAVEYGVRWCDETADLLKNLYNRREGP